MRNHPDIDRLLAESERHRRCLVPETNTQHHAAAIRAKAGMLVRPHRGMYARAEYWTSLDPAERARHIIRTLARQRPGRIFAGLSAAAMMRLEYGWQLHDDGTIFLASSSGEPAPIGGSPSGTGSAGHSHIRRIAIRRPPVVMIVRTWDGHVLHTMMMPPPSDASPPTPAVETGAGPPETTTATGSVRHQDARTHRGGMSSNMSVRSPTPDTATTIVDAVLVTSPARTLVDCGLRYPFIETLPMFDSAFRRHLVTREQILEVCDGMHADCGHVFRLLRHTNPLNENGGESRCYATIIDEGFAVPQSQVVFIDPDAPWNRYRADFTWHTPDGRVIVLEYDGTAKYVDPTMTKRRDIRDVVRAEREREAALRRAGVTTIARVNHDEVVRRIPLVHKLLEAGVPMAVAHPLYERPADTVATAR